MTEAQLDMVTAMHETMWRRLNALEVFYKGGQRAVDEFNKSTLTGIEKTKANAIRRQARGVEAAAAVAIPHQRREG
jgi:uncharacterized iron-regulated protein